MLACNKGICVHWIVVYAHIQTSMYLTQQIRMLSQFCGFACLCISADHWATRHSTCVGHHSDGNDWWTGMCLISNIAVFTELHGTQAVLVTAKPSICLSVTCLDCDKATESSAEIIVLYERSIIPVIRHEEWVEVTPPTTWNVGSKLPLAFKTDDFELISCRSA